MKKSPYVTPVGVEKIAVPRWTYSPWLLVDALVWAPALVLSLWLRFDFDAARTATAVDSSRFLFSLLAIAVVQILVGWTVGLYRGWYIRNSPIEIAAIGIAVLSGGCAGFVMTVLWGASDELPRSALPIAAAFLFLAVLWLRYMARLKRLFGAGQSESAEPVLVFGAGEAGHSLIRQIRRSHDSPYRVVAVLDDDPLKQRMRINGVKVVGTRDGIAAAADRFGTATLLIAVPSLDPNELRMIRDSAEEIGLHVLVLPPLDKMMHGRVHVDELREINVHDLLGRKPIQLDLKVIAGSLNGQRVLVTGAGGSIGSELCRQLNAFRPSELIMLDRDESALHAVQLSIEGKSMLDGDNTVLMDIRDRSALEKLFLKRRPDIVIHAAALKHLPLLEKYPLEAFKTNVVGTHNVIEAALKSGVSTFVNVSTDKAANPISVLGESKRVTERLTAAAARRSFGRYVSVRFGNVLGSRGSVLTAFEKQIKAGGPVTVTHPDVTRFFMTIPEACQLVLQAAAVAESGETMVLDMGEPLSIDEVARTLIAQSGNPDIEVVYTGLRDGEKLAEELFDSRENATQGDRHPLLSEVRVPPLEFDDVDIRSIATHATAQEWLLIAANPDGKSARPDVNHELATEDQLRLVQQ
ncbi:nucleoside-diphosphate sugar epimerase/dehydratase [Rhodococcus rhodochrous]|uniref:nucleoside-diphosphate sugar epimerase/dehydratase n=1 Tax=Rhodococcus rhodochrous TaxID=1829 RepID=UPI00177BD496|nr:nucleoside-diphosphate sugar epimerase/dehydratase [Rhodococcus rhodochrous]QOH58106.1 polysaccharide biosynthesis protein [Rhodococcus rhodochrous]